MTPLPGVALPSTPLFGTPLTGTLPLPGLPLFALLLLLFGCHLLGANRSWLLAAPDTVKCILYVLTVGDGC